MKKKPECWNCADPILNCVDCGMQTVGLTHEEAQDCISALTFFRREYKPKAPMTKAAMKRIEKKLWKLKEAP